MHNTCGCGCASDCDCINRWAQPWNLSFLMREWHLHWKAGITLPKRTLKEEGVQKTQHPSQVDQALHYMGHLLFTCCMVTKTMQRRAFKHLLGLPILKMKYLNIIRRMNTQEEKRNQQNNNSKIQPHQEPLQGNSAIELNMKLILAWQILHS